MKKIVNNIIRPSFLISRFFAPDISQNLEQKNAKKYKEHYDKFTKQNKIDINYFNLFKSGDIDGYIAKSEIYSFDDFNNKFL